MNAQGNRERLQEEWPLRIEGGIGKCISHCRKIHKDGQT